MHCSEACAAHVPDTRGPNGVLAMTMLAQCPAKTPASATVLRPSACQRQHWARLPGTARAHAVRLLAAWLGRLARAASQPRCQAAACAKPIQAHAGIVSTRRGPAARRHRGLCAVQCAGRHMRAPTHTHTACMHSTGRAHSYGREPWSRHDRQALARCFGESQSVVEALIDPAVVQEVAAHDRQRRWP